ncbi:hypothetical protein DFH08DRAFT_1033428 [Mycena albidolilacea]|uniref:Uncharacterized protein n=1 Tax=Mycena albidolilacea TaxID=1033008 RepID=A0AAD7EFS8_9AGAR|nr:hypothetical protein DFH08DRAFT_1033428 [Mycena albidolilacea]
MARRRGKTSGREDVVVEAKRCNNCHIGKFGSGNLRPALTSNSEKAELLKTIIQTRGGPNYHAHTKKALKTNIFGRYWTSEGIYETTNISPGKHSARVFCVQHSIGACEVPVGAVVPKNRNARSSSNFTDMTVPSRFPKLVDARRVKVLPRHFRLWTGAAGIKGPGGGEEAGIEYRAAGNERAWGGDQACGRRAVGKEHAGGSHRARMQRVLWAWAQARAAGNEREGDAYAGIKHRACRWRVRSAREVGGGHRARMERVSWANRGRGGSGRAAHRRRLSTERVGAKTAGNKREGGGQQARMGREQTEERRQRGHMGASIERG